MRQKRLAEDARRRDGSAAPAPDDDSLEVTAEQVLLATTGSGCAWGSGCLAYPAMAVVAFYALRRWLASRSGGANARGR